MPKFKFQANTSKKKDFCLIPGRYHECRYFIRTFIIKVNAQWKKSRQILAWIRLLQPRGKISPSLHPVEKGLIFARTFVINMNVQNIWFHGNLIINKDLWTEGKKSPSLNHALHPVKRGLIFARTFVIKICAKK